MKNIVLSLKEAQTIALQNQLLIGANVAATKKATLGIIEHLGYVQIDTISVIARAHHHILWTRNAAYKESTLNDLLEKDKSIFEYWSHAASFLPMKEYRFSLPQKKRYLEGKSHWFAQDKKMKRLVIERITQEGALQSTDFEHLQKDKRTWYEWKPAKRALEQLFMEGQLMVAKRNGFQKVYDLTERVLPAKVDTTMPSEKEWVSHLINSAIKAHGFVTAKEIAYLKGYISSTLKTMLTEMVEEGKLLEVSIATDSSEKYYSTKSSIKLISDLNTSAIHFVSPFDNILIQRKRLQSIFNFDYTIECYLPQEKRKYGYFVLPVLFNGVFVARIDCKADRMNAMFMVHAVFFEKNFKPTEQFNQLFIEKLKEFALFNNCESITLSGNSAWEKKLKGIIAKQLNA